MQGYTQYFVSSAWIIKYPVPFFSVLHLTFPIQLEQCLQMNYLQRTSLGKHSAAPGTLMSPRLLSGSPRTGERSCFPKRSHRRHLPRLHIFAIIVYSFEHQDSFFIKYIYLWRTLPKLSSVISSSCSLMTLVRLPSAQ